jgi:molecular chaperone DnaK
MIRIIGIDLGTTNTVAAQIKKGEPREIRNSDNGYLTPSALALNLDGHLLVGEDARTRGEGTVMSFKPDMGTDKTYEFNHRTYTPMELSALVLRKVKKDVETELGEPVLRAVITVPAWFNDRAISDTIEAGMMAGFYVVQTLKEPTAAALAWGMDREDSEPKTILVYDLGGGTFDISVLMVAPGVFVVLDHEGDVHLGGDDFDQLMLKVIRERQTDKSNHLPDDRRYLLDLKLACEKAKIRLSTQTTGEVNLAALGNFGTIAEKITREKLESLLNPWLAGPRVEKDKDGKNKYSTMEHVNLAILNSKLTPAEIDKILLVGGSTNIPLVQEILAKEFGKEKIDRTLNPMFCVAHGAAIQTELIPDIVCIKCHTKNQINATRCQNPGCGAPLIGEEKIDCPECFLPSPATETKCWKCGSELHPSTDPGHVPTKECPNGHQNPIDAQKCSKCAFVFETGIKCPECGTIIEQARNECPKCGKKKPGLFDKIPQSIGIETVETEGKTFSVILPKGTGFPTQAPEHKLYRTPQANQPQLQIVVWQGESTNASENDWLGELIMDLPKGVPEDAPIDISMNLNENGNIFVSAKLVDRPLDVVKAYIERVHDGVGLIKQAQGLLKKISDIQGGLGKEEQKQMAVLKAEIDLAVENKDSNAIKRHLKDWENKVTAPESKAKENEEIQGKINRAKNTLAAASDYIVPATKEEIQKLIDEAESAYNKGNMKSALEKGNRLDGIIDDLGGVNLITVAVLAANHEKVTSATRSQLLKVLKELETAYRTNNGDQLSKKIEELNELVLKAIQEVETLGGQQLPKPRAYKTGLGTGT